MTITVLHAVVQRDSRYWKDPDAFLPECWLTAEGDAYYPVKGAWRPFEFGRCVGNECDGIRYRRYL